jgi:chaperonin GroES|tara:strand:+ start:1245 stop:1748 length:504 start_codon:yes stop_codon:yes gene_type:complete
MTKKLLVPEYYEEKPKLKSKTKPKIKPVEVKEGVLQQAYVKAEERYLDPSKLSEKAIDRLPQPTGWRILLLPFQGRKQTDGGIILASETRERESVGTVCGYVLRVGPLAYNDPNKFEVDQPWCKAGDWVIFGKYAGSRFKIEGGEVRIINDDEILATISSPDDILHL